MKTPLGHPKTLKYQKVRIHNYFSPTFVEMDEEEIAERIDALDGFNFLITW